MKKIIVLAIALTAAVSAFAQFPKGLSVGAGYTFNKKTVKADGTEFDSKLNGFAIGANYNIAIGQSGLGVAPGIYFGFEIGDFFEGDLEDAEWKESNIIVPVYINYSIPVADILKIAPYVGPSFQLGLKSEASDRGYTADLYDDGLEGLDYKKTQIFLGAGVAVDIADIVRVNFGFDHGFISRFHENGISFKENRFNFGVAYLF